jgi:hypothetical protein
LQAPGLTERKLRAMKAILQATLAAILSGILVGVLLKKKVADATLPR